MTELTKPVKRKMKSRTLRHELVVLIEPGGILKLREKGGRKWYSVDLETLYKRLVFEEVSRDKKIRRITK